jgi:ubiquinone/menaquinone biosynthesis C-methylase UbiE
MRALRNVLLVGAGFAVGLMLVRHLRRSGHAVPGGILIDNAATYDLTSRLLFGSFFRPIAADVAATAPPGGRVLEIGCGPGHLAIRMAAEHGLAVTGLDLDPAMIERAQANAADAPSTNPEPDFVVGDAAALPFADASFDAVVSTLSMHHWEDSAAALAEIARVLRPGGQALIWDLGSSAPLHRHVGDPMEHLHDAPLEIVSVRPWRWPWRFALTQRMELTRPAAAG